jgi:hypothetical protein
MWGISRVLTYRARPFRVVVGCRRFTCGFRFARCLPRGLCFARGSEDRTRISFEELGPMVDVAAMPKFTMHAEFGAQKRRRKLGDKFLGGVRRKGRSSGEESPRR